MSCLDSEFLRFLLMNLNWKILEMIKYKNVICWWNYIFVGVLKEDGRLWKKSSINIGL